MLQGDMILLCHNNILKGDTNNEKLVNSNFIHKRCIIQHHLFMKINENGLIRR